jgi:hypothetical protein
MNQDIHNKLLAPFEDGDIEWRLQWVNDAKTEGGAVPYVTNRAIQYRLDEAVGCGGWKNEYIPWHSDGKKASQLCGVAIYDAERKEWITKYDGAEDSDKEPVKGGLSDSMKRAAVQWGIGRYLYGMDTVYVKVELRGKNLVIVKSEAAKLSRAHREHIARVPGKAPEPPQSPPEEKASGPRELPPVKDTAQTRVWVQKAAQVPSPSGKMNTSLQLRDGSGKTLEAFFQGQNPALKPGAVLSDPKFSKRENQGVTFIILDSFESAGQAA